MPRTLQDDLVDDVARTFLAPDHFGESATYTPREGSARSIVVSVRDDQAQRDDQPHHELLKRSIIVEASRDASTGIDNPLENETLVRAIEPTVTWSLRRVLNVEIGFVSLEFTSTSLNKSGRFRPQNL